MPKPPENTLHKALDGLIRIERGTIPTDEQLEAMQLALWAYMDGADATSTTELIKQGSELSRKAREMTEANIIGAKVHDYMNAKKVSKTNALQHIKSEDKERTRWAKLKKSKFHTDDQSKRKRFEDILNVVKGALQKKP